MIIIYIIMAIVTYCTISFYIGLINASNHNYTYNKIFFPSKLIVNLFKSIS